MQICIHLSFDHVKYFKTITNEFIIGLKSDIIQFSSLFYLILKSFETNFEKKRAYPENINIGK